MYARNVTAEQLEQALAKVNEKYQGNIRWHEGITPTPRGLSFRLTVNSYGPGSRLGIPWGDERPRHIHAACWHVHGDFYEALFAIAPQAVLYTSTRTVEGGKLKLTKDSDLWPDWAVTGPAHPKGEVMMSELCNCGKERSEWMGGATRGPRGRTRHWVGYKRSGGIEAFRSRRTPTVGSHGDRYSATVGPFRTARGAGYAAKLSPGGPPHFRPADWERAARHQELLRKSFKEAKQPERGHTEPQMSGEPSPLFDSYGHFLGAIPKEAVADCTGPGAADEAVAYWQKKLCFVVPRDKAIAYLREFGAWSVDELKAESDEGLAEKVLWLACGDIKENGEWFGLVH